MSPRTSLAYLTASLGLVALQGCPPTSAPRDAAADAPVVDSPAGLDVVGTDATDVVAPPLDAPSSDVVTPVGDGGPRPGCNPDGGIQCDGDWVGRCTPGCGEGQCCSPQHGSFACVPRGPDGYCPAPDLWIDGSKIDGHYSVQWRYFDPGNCAIVEGCVDAPGWRRLLRFDTWTPNTGAADMYLGAPSPSNPDFTYSSCHRHYHFNTYAQYELRSSGGDGGVVARGHKQAFCLEDFYHYPWDGMQMGGQDGIYNCSSGQGIEMGWQDVYGAYLDCQWVDVTAVPQGSYDLHIALNTEHLIAESDYTNDEVTVPIAIPRDDSHDDPTQACASSTTGTDRQCGWHLEGAHACTPGATVTAGCSAACHQGSCTGDTVMRVYDGDLTGTSPAWSLMSIVATNDDSGCGTGTCGRGGDCCSQVQFMCPTSGHYTVLTGSYDSAQTSTCTVATTP